MLAFFTVYDLPVWLALLSTFVLFLLVGRLIYWFSAKSKIEERKSFGKVGVEICNG